MQCFSERYWQSTVPSFELNREHHGALPFCHTVLAIQTLRARSACSASRADARVWTAARGVADHMRAIPPKNISRNAS
jgi:hypothetical protein